MSLRTPLENRQGTERSEAWQSQSLRLQLLETLREHFVSNDELSYI
ncbi:hypothetical protein [Nostoc sp. C052]|nr:hypothetical protein [Nostoc sp. C052]